MPNFSNLAYSPNSIQLEHRTYNVIGLMSGSSLDGLDIASCTFNIKKEPQFEVINWSIDIAATVPYSDIWQQQLKQLPQSSAIAFVEMDASFGHYLGQIVHRFLKKHQLSPDFIASHGHTIFHYPDKQFTTQIGRGAAIATETGYPVISDVRAMDVANGGQGAPIASIADRYLLSTYDFCLNTGGIFNVTYQNKERSIAFDITGANQILNALANELQLLYDENGSIAQSGKLNEALLKRSNELNYFDQIYPKSLDNQWVKKHLTELFVNYDAPVKDKLRTACEHIVFQTQQSMKQIIQKEGLEKNKQYKMIATGGGAFNTFLMELLATRLPELEIIIPSPEIIECKEALMIALMGVMRVENVPNCISSVTGAKRDVIGGAIHQGWRKQI